MLEAAVELTTEEQLEQKGYLAELEFMLKYYDGRMTLRQVEMLYFLSKGFTNNEIAQVSYLKEATVKFHMTKIFRHLEVKSRLEAAIKANEALQLHY